MQTPLIEQSFSDILRHGWELTQGAKTPILLALLIYLVVTTVLSLPAEFIDEEAEISGAMDWAWLLIAFVLSIASTVLGLSMTAGWLMMGVKRTREEALSAGQVWQYLHKTLPIVLAVLLTLLLYAIIAGIGFGLFYVIGGESANPQLILLPMLLVFGVVLYLGFCFSFAIYLVADQDMKPLESLLRSREIVQQHFWRLALVQSAFGLLLILGIFTLGIAWIWVLPWFIVTWGALYQDLFVEEEKATEIFDNSRYHQVF